ncbi:recombinase family protein [Bacillus cereus group sp. Bce006]|uniref:recombinase family protein n=1 Tax=Bacillus cereus group sp. Bce006 TaxID=3445255 RepID=UPI003F29612F
MRYGYARVSTLGQELESQVSILENEGCTSIYSEKFTGATTERPEFNKLLSSIQRGDTLVVTKLDRLARNTKEGITIIEGLLERGVKVHVLNVGLMEDTAMGRFFTQTILAVAELERSLILERTREGKEYARKNNPNFKEGRPKAVTTSQYTQCMKLLESHTVKEVANIMSISERTIYRYKRESKALSN